MNKIRIYFITIFIVNLFSNAAISKDLSGNTLDCFGKNNLYEEQVAFHFVNKNKVKYSYARIEPASGKNIIEILTREEIYKYKVTEDYILVETKPVPNLSFKNFMVEGTTIIDRKTRVVGRGKLGIGFPNPEGVKKSFAYPGIPTCKIVDIYTNDPFKKFDKYKIK